MDRQICPTQDGAGATMGGCLRQDSATGGAAPPCSWPVCRHHGCSCWQGGEKEWEGRNLRALSAGFGSGLGAHGGKKTILPFGLIIQLSVQL